MAIQNVYLNGELIPAEQARLSVFDAGFLHGASTFTTMLAHKGKVFRLDRHLQRLEATARALNFQVPVAAESLAQATGRLLAVNELSEARVRITLSPGSIRSPGAPTALITADALTLPPPEAYEKGITVVVSPYKQSRFDPTAGIKTGCYLPRMLARQEAATRGADEAFWFTTENLLAEACFSSIFLIIDGTVYTPPLETPVLPGVVRQAIIELCATEGVLCDDASTLTVREMLKAQEVFISASTSGIRPVVRIERHGVGDEKPGPVTKRLMAAYRQLLDTECS